MKTVVAFVLGLVAAVWFFWSISMAGLTILSYLSGGPDGWNAQLSYGLSLFGLVPVLGGIIASFMAKAVHGWGFFHAAFNFLGFILPAAIAGKLGEKFAATKPVTSAGSSDT